MKGLAWLHSAISVLFQRTRVESEMEEELRAHISDRAIDLERSGVAHAEAERRARLEFGGYERFKEECRQGMGAHFLETLRQDSIFALRLLRKSPVFTSVTVLTLALGIGANTAMFSLIYAVMLRPLPYAQPAQLVVAIEANLKQGVKETGCSYQDLQELQNSGVFSAIGGVSRHELTLTGNGDPTVVKTVVATPQLFDVFDVRPLAGRFLLPEDEVQGAAPVVLLSEGLWRTRFGANPDLLGRTVSLDQRPFTVVGIMPAGFRVPIFGRQDIWIPTSQDPRFSGFIPKRQFKWLGVIGRLKENASLPRAQSEVDSISHRLEKEFPVESGGWAVHLEPLQAAIVDDVRQPLLVLLGAVSMVLLLACVNIANLLLARATSRTREIAVRRALGAERGRIIRQLLTESTMLGLLGATLGIAMAYWGSHALTLLLPIDEPAMQKVQVDGWVLGFALVLSLAASIAFGLAPALLTASSDVQANLKDLSARAGSSRSRLQLRKILATAEMGLAAVLVVAAGLLVRSLVSMTAVNPGFEVAHVLKVEISLPEYQYRTQQQWTEFSDTLLERLQSQPGFADSAIAAPLPLADNFVRIKFTIDNRPTPEGKAPTGDFVSVSPAYFRTMGIPLLRGRLFARDDSASSPRVTVIGESLAQLYFRGENPIGKKLTFGFPPGPAESREILGVVGNVRDAALTKEPAPMMYVPFAQSPLWGGDVVVKSTLPTATVVTTLRDVVRGIDKDLPVTGVSSLPDVLDESVAQPRFRTWLLSAFGLVALLLAAAGVFGVISYSVASRTQEFGVRAALGATPRSIARLILREGLVLGAVGLTLGLITALGFAQFLKSQLFGIKIYDPATFVLSAGVLLGVAFIACYIPARRAMRVNPVIALRYE